MTALDHFADLLTAAYSAGYNYATTQRDDEYRDPVFTERFRWTDVLDQFHDRIYDATAAYCASEGIDISTDDGMADYYAEVRETAIAVLDEWRNGYHDQFQDRGIS